MSAIDPKIPLPLLPDNHIWSENRLDFFYDSDGKMLLPPAFFNRHIGRILRQLTTVTEEGLALTEKGMRWTDEAWPAWPFFDRSQRDDLHRPYYKYEKTPENQLKYAVFIQTYFGTSRNESLKFINHIHASLQDELIRRVNEDGVTLPNGDKPSTVEDVITILKSDEMAQLFESDKPKLYTYLYRWIKSLTVEEELQWVRDAIDDYFQDNGMHIRLASTLAEKSRRHSLVRIAVEKGTQSTKEKFKNVEAKAFGWVLEMKMLVDANSSDQAKLKTYLKRMASDNYDTVRLDPKIVPKNRMKYPYYWIVKVGTKEQDEEPNICGMLDVIISAAKSSNLYSVDEIMQIFREKLDAQDDVVTYPDEDLAAVDAVDEEQAEGDSEARVEELNLETNLLEGGKEGVEDRMMRLFGSTSEQANSPHHVVPMPEARVDCSIPRDGLNITANDTPNDFSRNTNTSILPPTPIARDSDACASNPITPVASTEDPHDSGESEEVVEYLRFNRFMMWICPNAIKSRWVMQDGMTPECRKEVEQRECAFALCNDCYQSLSQGSTRGSRGGRKRKLDPKECNHGDLTSGMNQETNHLYFTEDMVEKHGCKECSNCKKLIPLKK